jgi:ribosome biogenesis GTPase
MNRQQKRQQKDIEKHLGNEELKLRKQARNIRKASTTPTRAARGDVDESNWEEVMDEAALARVRARAQRRSLGDLVGELRAETATGDDEVDDAAFRNAEIVAFAASGRCRILRDGALIDAFLPKEIAVAQQTRLAVGDRVVAAGDTIERVLPRRTVLSRPDPHNPNLQRVVAANIDVVIHVVSVKTPPLRPRLIDRYLIAIQRGGAAPVLCVNKVDLLEQEELDEELSRLEPYHRIGIPIVLCSTKTGQGLDTLRDLAAGRTSVLVGHSGVGKSSILNALDERLELATGGLHRRGTGRHTTSSSTLHDFGDGTYLIDTPGVREFGLWDLDLPTLASYFPEFDEVSDGCRFNDCTHTHEPGCAVKAAVEEGTLSADRYETFLRLADDIDNSP